MSAILEISTFRNRAHLISVKEYHTLGELGYLSKRTELIEGVVLNKMPNSPKHATMILRILKFLGEKISTGFHIRSEQPLTLMRSEPEPDISIVRGGIDDYSLEHPQKAELVIEVSLSTLSEDREMASIYAEADIFEYWIFNLNSCCVEVYTKPHRGRYSEMKTYFKEDSLSPQFDPKIKLELSTLFL